MAGILLVALLLPAFHHVCAAGRDQNDPSVLRCCCAGQHQPAHYRSATEDHCEGDEEEQADPSHACCGIQLAPSTGEATLATVDGRAATYVSGLVAPVTGEAVVSRARPVLISDASGPPTRSSVALHVLHGAFLN